MEELVKVLDECLTIVEQIRGIINTPYLPATTWGGEAVYAPNNTPMPVNKLIAKLYELVPLVKPYNEILSNRIKNNIDKLPDIAGVNPYQFGGIINLLGLLKSEIENYTFVKIKRQVGTPKIFISHSTEDLKYIRPFVNLLEKMGIKQDQLFCSSVEGYHIPMSDNDEDDIYKYLHNQFQDHQLYVIFMLSENYYKSPVCLNEMGAAWVLRSSYQSILLPNFNFPQIKGVVNPRKISFKLDDKENRGYKLSELRENIINKLSIPNGSYTLWERQRNEFLSEIDRLCTIHS